MGGGSSRQGGHDVLVLGLTCQGVGSILWRLGELQGKEVDCQIPMIGCNIKTVTWDDLDLASFQVDVQVPRVRKSPVMQGIVDGVRKGNEWKALVWVVNARRPDGLDDPEYTYNGIHYTAYDELRYFLRTQFSQPCPVLILLTNCDNNRPDLTVDSDGEFPKLRRQTDRIPETPFLDDPSLLTPLEAFNRLRLDEIAQWNLGDGDPPSMGGETQIPGAVIRKETEDREDEETAVAYPSLLAPDDASPSPSAPPAQQETPGGAEGTVVGVQPPAAPGEAQRGPPRSAVFVVDAGKRIRDPAAGESSRSLALTGPRKARVRVAACSSFTGAGLRESLAWLSEAIAKGPLDL
uniref:Uncharacterized protein n=1 Tax=Chromera velia CCMP2878 TaxID=1169474 RepID=A0A0G4HA84_9ALVE|eukprot:Cvel_6015.t1-p1 / transcript=Cvel_6015.t1 / gene=Cvel_6015 / organism=Chromera_velia_CCMP2878 / gene_product=hypothetical protein / transcript_product=hypothetical protein / location=Cvel_scaffold288:32083-33126(-) / protein_length=348 / sequence_SO=supercontig / SO=protein_coding / is_pseudo=false